MDEGALRNVCARFRAAIERCDRDRFPPEFQQFPAGTCGDASLILGHHLRRLGRRGLKYCLGYRLHEDHRTSHAWLQTGDLVIDITADQFPEIEDRVIVRRSSAWHDAWHGEAQHLGDFSVYKHDPYTLHKLAALYAAVLSEMRAAGDTDLPDEQFGG